MLRCLTLCSFLCIAHTAFVEISCGPCTAKRSLLSVRGSRDWAPSMIAVAESAHAKKDKLQLATVVDPTAAHSASSVPRSTQSPLEATILRGDLGFEEKMLVVSEFFESRPFEVAARLAEVTGAVATVFASWQLEEKARMKFLGVPRTDVLRDSVSKLGVVFVKLAQTMATRPDIVGDEAAEALGELQDSNRPFPNSVAYKTLQEDLQWSGPLFPGQPDAGDGRSLLLNMTPSPLAAASLAQVYKGTTDSGVEVALKVRRPGVVQQIALDMYCVRLLLRLTQQYGLISQQADIVDMTTSVGDGLFGELDFQREAANAAKFAQIHNMEEYVKVPRSVPSMCTTRVLTTQWINGVKLPDLPEKEQIRMVQMGLDICFTQLLRTGFIHADPHYGNMLFTSNEPRPLCLLDFGLVTTVSKRQQDAMATSILHTLQEDWRQLILDFRELGLLPQRPSIWVDRVTKQPISGLEPGEWKYVDEAEFMTSFENYMRSKDRAGRKRTFSELTQDMTILSLTYRFILPSWMLFVIRSVITLDGFAAELSEPINAIEAAFPHALRRALCPTTIEGRKALYEAFLTADGDLQWERLSELAQAGERCGEDADPEMCEVGGFAVKPQQTQQAATILQELLLTSEGAALRRLLYSLNTRLMLQRMLLMAPQLLKVASTPKVASQVLRLVCSPLRKIQQGHIKQPLKQVQSTQSASEASGTSASATLSPSPPPPAALPAWRGRKVARLLIGRHLRSIVFAPRAAAVAVATGSLLVAVLLRALATIFLTQLKRGFAHIRQIK